VDGILGRRLGVFRICGNAKISSFPNNNPLADLFRASCSEEFELKSQKGKFGAKVLGGEYKTKCERLAASNNPNLLLMNYDLKSLAVVNLFIVPKHFFVREIIEERKPLAATARRAGWIGSKILLDRVPESGKIHIVQNGVIRPKDIVLAEWQKTLFLRDQSLEARGWLLDWEIVTGRLSLEIVNGKLRDMGQWISVSVPEWRRGAIRPRPAIDRRRAGTSRRVEEEVRSDRDRNPRRSLRSRHDRAGVRLPRPVAGRRRRRAGMADPPLGRCAARYPSDLFMIALVPGCPGLLLGAAVGAPAWRTHRWVGALLGAVIGFAPSSRDGCG
jgi:Dam-replacing family protein